MLVAAKLHCAPSGWCCYWFSILNKMTFFFYRLFKELNFNETGIRRIDCDKDTRQSNQNTKYRQYNRIDFSFFYRNHTKIHIYWAHALYTYLLLHYYIYVSPLTLVLVWIAQFSINFNKFHVFLTQIVNGWPLISLLTIRFIKFILYCA